MTSVLSCDCSGFVRAYRPIGACEESADHSDSDRYTGTIGRTRDECCGMYSKETACSTLVDWSSAEIDVFHSTLCDSYFKFLYCCNELKPSLYTACMTVVVCGEDLVGSVEMMMCNVTCPPGSDGTVGMDQLPCVGFGFVSRVVLVL